MGAETSAPGPSFAKVLRSFQTGGITYNDFLSLINQQLAAGAWPAELLEILRRRQLIEPLPDYAHDAVTRLLNRPPPEPLDDTATPPEPVTVGPTTPAERAAAKPTAPPESASVRPTMPAEQPSAKSVAPPGPAIIRPTIPTEQPSAKSVAPPEPATVRPTIPTEQASAKPVAAPGPAIVRPTIPTEQAITKPVTPPASATVRSAASSDGGIVKPAASPRLAIIEPAPARDETTSVLDISDFGSDDEPPAAGGGVRPETAQDFVDRFAATRRRSRWKRGASWFCAAIIAAVVGWLYSQPSAKIETPPSVTNVAPPEPTPASSTSAKAGAVIHDCPSCPSMTVLPPGRFKQGSANSDHDALPVEKPQHVVLIRYPFAISTNDVTVNEFRDFVTATGREMQGCDTYDGKWQHRSDASWKNPGFTQSAHHPVTCVSWNDAAAYAQWLSTKSGHR
jgi:hypothetical protein